MQQICRLTSVSVSMMLQGNSPSYTGHAHCQPTTFREESVGQPAAGRYLGTFFNFFQQLSRQNASLEAVMSCRHWHCRAVAGHRSTRGAAAARGDLPGHEIASTARDTAKLQFTEEINC